MNKLRKKPIDVLELNQQIDSFIHEGTNASSSSQTTNPKPQFKSGAESDGIDEDPSTDRTHQASRKKSKPRIAQTRWMQTTLSKATIQKTVRFNPQLIAKWEQRTQIERENGKTPKSFQQVQNEALELWLHKNNI